jgi:hypothetical protein
MKCDEPFGVIAGLDPAIHHFAKKMDHQNSGVPEFWPFRWTQIGNIRFALVKPAGDAQVNQVRRNVP